MTLTHTVLHNCHRQHCMTSPGAKQTGIRLQVWNLFGKFLDQFWPEKLYFLPWNGISVPCSSCCPHVHDNSCCNCNVAILLFPELLYLSFQCDHPCYRILLRTCNLKYSHFHWSVYISGIKLKVQNNICNYTAAAVV
jgi:hypothetical protein